MVQKFRVGDRVEAVEDHIQFNERILKGYVGTICNFRGRSIGVVWDKGIGGHDCDGNCKKGHGWYVDPECIKPHKDDDIIEKFHIGDRVEASHNYPSESSYIIAGDTGTVCDFDDDYIGVAWDEPNPEGHDCSGHCEYGHGWYVQQDYIEPYFEVCINDESFLEIVSKD